MSARLRVLGYRFGEVLCYVVGLLLSATFLVQLAQGEVQRQSGIAAFEHLAQSDVSLAGYAHDSLTAESGVAEFEFEKMVGDPDTTLWAPGRIADYQASLMADLPPVVGVLEVPTVNLKVPVYQSNSDLVMDRGAGIVEGMSYPHEPGNIGISGHRDGYFRVLKDVEVGDPIVLRTLEGPKHFRIEDTAIVEIKDKSLLQDTREQTITLVTCYPFYFVGHAPKRFIVTASLDTTYVNRK